MGVHDLTWAVVDLAGKVLHKEVVGAVRFRGGMFVTHLRNTINAALKHCREQGFNLQGIGISFPGVVDQENRITLAPNIGGEGVGLADLVEDGVGLPVHIDNDARLGARQIQAGEPARADHCLLDGRLRWCRPLWTDESMQGELHSGDIGHAVVDQGRALRLRQFVPRTLYLPALVRRINDPDPPGPSHGTASRAAEPQMES